MRKCIAILILGLVLMIYPVLASTTCEISRDNSSWDNIESTKYDGEIVDGVIQVQNLEEGTVYFARCMNATSPWVYSKFKTKDAVLGESMIAIIGGIIFLMVMSGYGIVRYKGYRPALTILFFLLLTLMFYVMAAMTDSTEVISPVLWNLYTVSLWAMFGVVIFVIAGYILVNARFDKKKTFDDNYYEK